MPGTPDEVEFKYSTVVAIDVVEFVDLIGVKPMSTSERSVRSEAVVSVVCFDVVGVASVVPTASPEMMY